jgi:soluble lytic murein transglycosylase
MGLMQVMPGTGRDTAGALGIAYSQSRLLSDPDYNLLLGATYIEGLIDRFDGNLVLVSIGYNAGPRRASDWIERFGDPREAEDIVFWIEALPFTETRNYVMRVTEGIPVYRARLTGQTGPVAFRALLQGTMPVIRPRLRPESLGAAAADGAVDALPPVRRGVEDRSDIPVIRPPARPE